MTLMQPPTQKTTEFTEDTEINNNALWSRCPGMKNSIFMFIYEPQFIADSVVDHPFCAAYL